MLQNSKKRVIFSEMSEGRRRWLFWNVVMLFNFVIVLENSSGDRKS